MRACVQKETLYLKLCQNYNKVKKAGGKGTASAGPTSLQAKGSSNTTQFRKIQCVADHITGRRRLHSTTEKLTALGGETRVNDRVAKPAREGNPDSQQNCGIPC